MIKFPSGNEYKLVYLDTNCINEISKNTKKMGKVFMERYCVGGYMFVTSTYNLFELSKTSGNTRKNIIEIFNKLPLAIIQTFPQLIEFEKIESSFNHNMIMFAMGLKPLFNVQLETVLNNLQNDKDFANSINNMKLKFQKQIIYWTKKQQLKNWCLNFNKEMIFSMNETFQLEFNNFKINVLGKYKSLEILAYIKNQFIYDSKKDILIGSIIDSYNCSILPYVDIYITEKTVGSWLEKAKKRFKYIENKEIVKLSDLMETEIST